MMKYVISDYLAALKWGNIKEKHKNDAWFFLLYMLFFYPMFRVGDNEDNRGMMEWIKYFLVIIPPIYAVSTSSLMPVGLTKYMFLVPLNKEKRREYIDMMRKIKTIVPIVMLTISTTILIAMGMMDIIVASGFFISNVLIVLFCGMNINSQNYSRVEEKGVLETSASGTMLLCEMVMLISAFIANIVFLAIDCKQDSLSLKLIMIFMCMIFQLPATIAYLRYWPLIRDKFSEYETCLRKSNIKEIEV